MKLKKVEKTNSMEQQNKLVREAINFERNPGAGSIKDKLLGFRPGQLITYSKEREKDSKPYLEVYMYVGPDEDSAFQSSDATRIRTYQVGVLVRSVGASNFTHFSLSNLKKLEAIGLFKEGKRGLTAEEIQMVKDKISQYPDFMEKIKRDTGILPTLNEGFKRGKTGREIIRSLFDWRRGQILVVRASKSGFTKDEVRGIVNLYVFYEKKDSTIPSGSSVPWNIHALEIGSIAGDPRYVHIHFGPFQGVVIKREDSLEEPTPEEKVLIIKALNEPKYKKYIKRATELIGVEPFV